MGHAIEELAKERGHEIVYTVDNDSQWPMTNDQMADVAIEFSTPTTAVENIHHCWQLGLPVVCGTTGWNAQYETLKAECLKGGHTLFTASNFSIGMNIMFALNERMAELMQGRDSYHVSISETHHIHKLDAPSGTAITLKEQIAENGNRRTEDIPIESFRIGEEPGTHSVVYRSEIDTLTLTHEAHSRKGLALGALLAAEWVAGRSGVFTMKDLLA